MHPTERDQLRKQMKLLEKTTRELEKSLAQTDEAIYTLFSFVIALALGIGISSEEVQKMMRKSVRDARKKGQVARSHELNYALVLLFSAIALYFMSRGIFAGMARGLEHYLGSLASTEFTTSGTISLIERAGWESLTVFLPFSILALFVGIMANVLQIGFLITPEPLKPKWDRINPIGGLRRIFSLRGTNELFKSFLKITAVSVVAFLTVKSLLGELFSLSHATTGGVLIVFGQMLFKLAIRCALALLFVALLDLLFVRWQHEKSLRMSVQEVKEEMKELYGDPIIRGKLQRVRRQMTGRRALARVAKAHVLVIHPGRYAVALMYDRDKMIAPKVVSKGKGFLADRILELAERRNIPTVESQELARQLCDKVDFDGIVPEKYYQDVATVFAYLHGLENRRPVTEVMSLTPSPL